MNRELLEIYLQDHFAGAAGGHDLAERAARENAGNSYGTFLATLTAEIEEDQATLAAVMDRLGVEASTVKTAGAWLGEKIGRLKANGSLTDYTPLSRLVELEGLTVGVTGKRLLWEHLARVSETDADPVLAEWDFPALAGRAQAQIDGLAEQRASAAPEAFAS